MRTAFVALRALTFMSGFFLLWGWLAWSLRTLDRSLGSSVPAWTQDPGLALMAVGAAIVLTCGGLFVLRGQGTPAPFDAPRHLVAAGPYRYVRNPMYVGGFVVLMGFALFVQSISVLLFSLVWLLPAHAFVVCYEEPTLRSRFGAAYARYCETVPRWIPRLRPAVLATVLLGGVAMTPAAALPARPNFTGEWTLNAGKSDFGLLPPPPAGWTGSITAIQP